MTRCAFCEAETPEADLVECAAWPPGATELRCRECAPRDRDHPEGEPPETDRERYVRAWETKRGLR